MNTKLAMAVLGAAGVFTYGGHALAAPPANDNLANATTVPAAGGDLAGTNVDATKETGEPEHAGVPGGASIWYTWTPASSGLVAMSTQGSLIDSVLGVYTGAAYPLTLVADNDDEDFGSGIVTSRVSFSAVAGTTYKIAIDGFDGESGSIQLHVIPGIMAPSNDNLVDAAAITGNVGSAMGTNVDATKETGELNIAGNPGGASVWWTWTAPVSDTYMFNTHGSTFDTIMGVYTGAAHPLALVAEGDDSSQGTSSEVSFPALAGTTYKIAVDGYDGGTGNINLGWSITVPEVISINLTGSSLTNASSAGFSVTFSEPVTGVDVTDFATSATGISGSSVAAVNGSGTSFTVTVNTGNGSGVLGLNLVDDDSITDAAGQKLGGNGAGNGSFSQSQTYIIDKTAPAVHSITAVSGTVVDIKYTESNGLGASALTATNYTVSGPGKGTVGNNPASVTQTGTDTRRLTWSSGSMINGQPITITVTNVQDTAGNAIGAQNSATNLALPVTLSGFTVE